jgi:dihydrofolate synthase/folylpolyglutamate synthase
MTSAPSSRSKREARPASRTLRPLRTKDQAVAYLLDRTNFERIPQRRIRREDFKLDRMHALLAALGDPHRGFRSVHVAGSKGKGSVCEMLTSALGACGYAVGLYTSPHLVDFNERIRVCDRAISDDDFVDMTNRVREGESTLGPAWGQTTFFELMTAMAFCYFVRQAVDVAVIEVGLGGRLDCTNVVTPVACGLASIQLEHTDILGSTIEEVAAEKAGIIKPGVPVVTVRQDEAVMEAFRRRAEAVGAPLIVLGEDIEYSWRFEADTSLGPHARVCVTSPRIAYEHIAVPLKGEHQAANCGLALALLDQLVGQGFAAPEREVAEGLARTPAAGRLELAWASPRILLDTAHTPDSVSCLVRAIGAHLRFDSLVAIFGCSSDKAVDAMLLEVARGADKVIFTKVSDNPRAMDPEELARRFRETTGTMCQTEANLTNAINTAVRAVGRDDLILVTGSCYLVGEAKRRLLEHAAKKAASEERA